MSPSGASTTIPAGVEFPSQRRERIDWHKLASIDLRDLISGCPIEVLQENLTQVAFCDAEAEFDLGTLAGQRNLLKVFRLAQLIVQYLFLSQDFMETQLKEAQEEADELSEKYQQVKVKLLQQVEEARKMKATNKNMRETVKHINSFAIANGMFQAVRCPKCSKTFRSSDFLQSHLWRKHPGYASSISIPPATQTMPSTVSPAQVTLVPSATPPGLNPSIPPLQTNQVPLITPEIKKQEEAATSTVTPTLPVSVPYSMPSKVNDVDSYRLNEIERKCETMSDSLFCLIRELEEQKRVLEAAHSRKQEEVKQAWEEKRSMEEHYEAQLEKLSHQVSQLQSMGLEVVQPTTTDGDDLRELVRRQEGELRRLQDQIESQAAGNRVDEIRGLDEVDGLQEQLQALKRQLHEQERKHRRSLREMQDSLQKNYEKALSLEKDRLEDMMKDFSRGEPVGTVAVIPHKPPPSPKTPNTVKKPPVPNMATKPSVITHMVDSLPSSPQPYPAGRSKGIPQPQLADMRDPQSNKPPHHQPHLMDADDTESETESETDTSYWNQNKLKVKHLQISSLGKEETQINRNIGSLQRLRSSESTEEEEEEDEEEEESQTGSEGTSESLHLEALLRDNPQLWGHMKEATAEVLASKLNSLGIISTSKGIKTETLTACLAQVRKDRKTLERKHGNFYDLRKRLENEVMAKVDDKIDDVDDTSSDDALTEAADRIGRQGGVLSRMVKNVQSKVKERSKAISSSVSKTGSSMKSGMKDIFQTTNMSSNVQMLTGTHKKDLGVSKDATLKDESSEEEEEEEDYTDDSKSESSSARIEVHNETMKSVKRNLFSNPERDTGTNMHPRHPSGYFDNKTYGEEEEEEESETGTGTGWDSEPEYENMKEEPPKRTDSLCLSLEPVDLHATPKHTWQPAEEAQPIKVKRPSGEKVSGLARTIEMQLSGRKKTKLAGAVDVTTSLEASKDNPMRRMSAFQDSLGIQELQSMSESSNTVRTSMWGSAEALGKEEGKENPPRPSTSRGRVHSWDSEEDLNISDLE